MFTHDPKLMHNENWNSQLSTSECQALAALDGQLLLPLGVMVRSNRPRHCPWEDLRSEHVLVSSATILAQRLGDKEMRDVREVG